MMSALASDRSLRFAYALLALAGAYFLAVHAFPKLFMTEAVYTDYYWPRRYWLIVHVVAGLGATLLGPLQFFRKLRSKQPALHRILGRTYLIAVLLAATSALALAVTTTINAVYSAGLCVAATSWISSGLFALQRARQRQFPSHREWMVRNYVITFFFIVFFGVFDLLTALKIGTFESNVGWLAWACWIVPLVASEAMLRARRRIN
jgi:uncharacterized membrane protein